MSATNSANNGYLPSIGFWRQGTIGRVIGLDTAGKFKTIDSAGGVGFLLDTITKVATADVQDKAITFAKLADSLVALLVAPGTVHAFAGPSPPTGWVICDGHEESRTGSTAALFAAIGTYWGVGNNSTTFNVPNFVNRVPVGYGAGAMWGFGNAAYTPTDLGQVNLALTTAQLPSHTHTITDQQHSHSINAHQHGYVNPIGTSVGVAPGGMSVTQASGVTNTNATQSTMNNSYSNINTTNANGSGAVHNNMPPFAMLYYIIKI